MTRPRLEVAEVFRSCRDEYFATHSASAEQRRAFRNIVACRTAALGGHVNRCDRCAHEEVSYNSCRDRHCPKCRAEDFRPTRPAGSPLESVFSCPSGSSAASSAGSSSPS